MRYANPIDHLITTPSAKHEEMESLTADERDRFLGLDEGWTPLFTLLSITGMRLGEALGLSWSNVDLKKGEIRVLRTLQRVTALGLLFGVPKTDKSRRSIPLEQRVVTALKVQKLQANEGPDDLVFPNTTGGNMEPSRVNRALRRSLKEIESSVAKDDIESRRRWGHLVETFRVHDLRHTAASIMIQKGAAPKAVQEILGHSSYTTTMNLYVHTNNEMLREAMERGAAAEAVKA